MRGARVALPTPNEAGERGPELEQDWLPWAKFWTHQAKVSVKFRNRAIPEFPVFGPGTRLRATHHTGYIIKNNYGDGHTK